MLELVREDDPEYSEAQAKVKAFKKQLGIADTVAEQPEKAPAKPGVQE